MKKLLLLMCVLLTGVSGAWAQLTSITDKGYYNLQFSRTDQNQVLGVKKDLTHAEQNTSVVGGVFQFILTGTANTYYIKEYSTGQYVYATKTTDSSGSDIRRMNVGATELPTDDSSTDQDKKLSAYKWIVEYFGDQGYATNAWTIKPSQNTGTYCVVWSQTAANPVAFYSKNTPQLDYYIWRYLQIVTPTLESMITAGCKVSEITSAGYTKDQIAEYYKPTTLDVVGWPTTAAWNTFKTAINALADNAVVSTAYLTPYQTMCSTITQPSIGTFYRIKDKDNNYIYANGSGAQLLTAATPTNPMTSVFYYTTGNSLLSLSDGLYAYEENGIVDLKSTTGTYHSFIFDHSSSHPIGSTRIHINEGSVDYYWYTSSNKVYNSRYNSTNAERAFYFEEVTSLPITFKGQYASFYSPVDLTLPTGVKAYTGKLNGDNTKLTLSEVDYVPANTGVILEYAEFSSEPSKDFPILSTVTPVAGTSLTGTVAAQSATAGTKLVLGKEDENWGIYAYGSEGTVTLNGFKAYMDMPAGGGSVKGFKFSFDDETAIEALTSALQSTDCTIYNLAGQRINRLQRGVNIVNGKKVLVK